jgi:hypothetical protein
MTEARYALSPGAMLQVASGEALLVNLEAEEMFALNETGAAIVMRLTDGQDLGALIDALAQEYRVERAEIARDVRALVDELVGRHLLVPAPGSGRP